MNSPILALDIGLKRTGLAISESGMIAQPLGVVEAKPPHMTNVVTEILERIKEYGIKTLVIGMPFDQDDAMTSQALKVEQIIAQIERALSERPEAVGQPVEIVRINEYHSSQDAKLLFPTTDIDAAAATIILQDYLDQNAS